MKPYFDVVAFCGEVDRQRRTHHMTWKQVSSETGVNASTLTRMMQGKCPDIPNLVSLLHWACLDFSTFMHDKGKQQDQIESTLVPIQENHQQVLSLLVRIVRMWIASNPGPDGSDSEYKAMVECLMPIMIDALGNEEVTRALVLQKYFADGLKSAKLEDSNWP